MGKSVGVDATMGGCVHAKKAQNTGDKAHALSRECFFQGKPFGGIPERSLEVPPLENSRVQVTSYRSQAKGFRAQG